MYAVISTGGKQYKVAEGDVLRVERLDAVVGDSISFVTLMVSDGGETRVGKDAIGGAKVTAKVKRHSRAEKIAVFKYKAKKNERKRRGHRQSFTEVVIEKIAK